MAASLEKAAAPNRYFNTLMTQLNTVEGAEFRKLVAAGVVATEKPPTELDEEKKTPEQEKGEKVEAGEKDGDPEEVLDMVTMTVNHP
jgi:hypothetical protein